METFSDSEKSINAIRQFLNGKDGINIGESDVSLVGLFSTSQANDVLLPNGNFIEPHALSEFSGANYTNSPSPVQSARLIPGENLLLYENFVPTSSEIKGTQAGGGGIFYTPNAFNSTNSIAIKAAPGYFTDIKDDLPSGIPGIKDYFYLNGVEVIITFTGSVYSRYGNGEQWKQVMELTVGTGSPTNPYTEAGVWLSTDTESGSGWSANGTTALPSTYVGAGGDWSVTLNNGLNFIDDSRAAGIAIRTVNGIHFIQTGSFRHNSVYDPPIWEGLLNFPQKENWKISSPFSSLYLPHFQQWKNVGKVQNSSSGTPVAYMYSKNKMLKSSGKGGIGFHVTPMKGDSVWKGYHVESAGPVGYKIMIVQGGYSSLNYMNRNLQLGANITKEQYEANPDAYNQLASLDYWESQIYAKLDADGGFSYTRQLGSDTYKAMSHAPRLINPGKSGTFNITDKSNDYNFSNTSSIQGQDWVLTRTEKPAPYMHPTHKALWDSLHDASGYIKKPDTVKLAKSNRRQLTGTTDSYHYESHFQWHWSYWLNHNYPFLEECFNSTNGRQPGDAGIYEWYDSRYTFSKQSTDACSDMMNESSYVAVIDGNLFAWGSNKYGKLGVGDYGINRDYVNKTYTSGPAPSNQWTDTLQVSPAVNITPYAGSTLESIAHERKQFSEAYSSNTSETVMHRWSPWGQWFARPVHIKYDHHGNQITGIKDIACTESAIFILKSDGTLLASGAVWRPIGYVDRFSFLNPTNQTTNTFDPNMATDKTNGVTFVSGTAITAGSAFNYGPITQNITTPNLLVDTSEGFDWNLYINGRIAGFNTRYNFLTKYYTLDSYKKQAWPEFAGYYNSNNPNQSWSEDFSTRNPVQTNPVYPSRFENLGLTDVSEISAIGNSTLLVKDGSGRVFQLNTDPRERHLINGWDANLTIDENFTSTQQFESAQTISSSDTGNHPTGL
jgi:hypothetical protein